MRRAGRSTAEPGADAGPAAPRAAPLLTSPGSSPLHHSNFRVRVWLPAIKAAGLSGLHFHDLRHTGNTLAAVAGATLRELMDRMGHDSERAAMIYLHGSEARQHEIADTLSKLTLAELKGARGARAGSQRARGPEECFLKINSEILGKRCDLGRRSDFGWCAWQDSNPRPAA